LHGIPLLALIFKTIGLGYLIWFVIRYWLKAETRRELYDTVNTWIDLVLGTSEASDSDAQ
jgi:threonine/homoserine/homoserine lactone efflux protein